MINYKSIYMKKCVFEDNLLAKYSSGSYCKSRAWCIFWRTYVWACVYLSFLKEVANSGRIGAGHSDTCSTLKLPMVRNYFKMYVFTLWL